MKEQRLAQTAENSKGATVNVLQIIHMKNLNLNYYPFLVYMFEEHLQILRYETSN